MYKSLLRISVLAGLVLTLTGFAPVLRGHVLTGYALLLHVALGGLLAVTFTLMLILTGLDHGPGNAHSASPVSAPCKLCYWLIVASTLVLILSVLAAMVPLLGTHAQHLAISIHRYAALLFILAAMGYALLRKR
ncbi:MAG: hypothetical protein O3C57_07405 [Verrucomicrobia bacterium]|nr:hypothetical protein [Verrucomicrobiota bacterium]